MLVGSERVLKMQESPKERGSEEGNQQNGLDPTSNKGRRD